MENNNQIDEIIREGLANFEPIAPEGVWEGIEQSIQGTASNGAQGVGNQLLEAFKQMGLASKIATLAVLPLAISGVIWLSMGKPQESQKQINTSTANQPSLIEELPSDKQQILESESVADNKGKPVKGSSFSTITEKTKQETPVVVDMTETESKAKEAVFSEPKNTVSGSEKPKESSRELAPEVPIIKHQQVVKEDQKGKEFSFSHPEFGNVFSPDGDGKNDTWEIRIDPTVFYHLKVFNALGHLVFETEQVGNFWNGTDFKTGVECESGQYTYIFDYQFDKSEKVITKTGFINLLR